MSGSACSEAAISAATTTPPLGIPNTKASRPRYAARRLASRAPASLRSRKIRKLGKSSQGVMLGLPSMCDPLDRLFFSTNRSQLGGAQSRGSRMLDRLLRDRRVKHRPGGGALAEPLQDHDGYAPLRLTLVLGKARHDLRLCLEQAVALLAFGHRRSGREGFVSHFHGHGRIGDQIEIPL